MSGPSSPTSNETRPNASNALNSTPIFPNFRPSEQYDQVIPSPQSSSFPRLFRTPFAPMVAVVPTNTNGLYYGGLPGPPQSQLPPITVPPNQEVAPLNGAPLYHRHGGPVSSIHLEAPQKHQSSEIKPPEQRSKPSSAKTRSVEELVSIFTKWLDEYDQRSQNRYEAARKMYYDLDNDVVGWRKKIETEHAEFQTNLPHLGQLSQRVGECVAGNRQLYDRITRLQNRLTKSDDKSETLSNRVVACETGLAQMEGIRADLAKQAKSIDRISEDVRSIDGRTSKVEDSSLVNAMDARITNIEEQMHHHRQQVSEHSDILQKITTLETQMTAIQNDQDDRRRKASCLNNSGKEIEMVENATCHLQGNRAEVTNGFKAAEATVVKDWTVAMYDEIKTYDPSSSSARNNGLERIFTAFISNPTFAARLKSTKHHQQPQSPAANNGENSQQPRVGLKAGKLERHSTSQMDVEQAKDHARGNEARAGPSNLSRSNLSPASPRNSQNRKEGLSKQRRSRTVHDSDSEDEVEVRRLKKKFITTFE